MSIARGLLAEFDQESAVTRKLLQRLPEAQFGYRPHPKSMTLGDLASHLVNIWYWGELTLKEREFDVAPGGKPLKQEGHSTLKALLEANDAKARGFRAALESADDASFMQPWALKSNGQVVFEMPRVAVVRAMIFNHHIHHRAQLGVYLRMLDVPVPSVYGPSADEQ